MVRPRGGAAAVMRGGTVQHILALSHSAVIVRHWFEIDLGDAAREHGARIELRELAPQPHRGSESAAQLIAADRPLWRADLFDRLTDAPGTFGVAHYHPGFSGNEPSSRAWDPELTADRWPGRRPGPGGLAAGARRRQGTEWPGGYRRHPGQGAWARSLPVGRRVLRADPGCAGVGTAHDRIPAPAR